LYVSDIIGDCILTTFSGIKTSILVRDEDNSSEKEESWVQFLPLQDGEFCETKL
jgi:hypothetical protein